MTLEFRSCAFCIYGYRGHYNQGVIQDFEVEGGNKKSNCYFNTQLVHVCKIASNGPQLVSECKHKF